MTEPSLVNDWFILPGMDIQVRIHGRTVCTGTVDCVSNDGMLLWLYPDADTRKIIEKGQGYEAWATQTPGMIYRTLGPGSFQPSEFQH